jgi:hypothetical protein
MSSYNGSVRVVARCLTLPTRWSGQASSIVSGEGPVGYLKVLRKCNWLWWSSDSILHGPSAIEKNRNTIISGWSGNDGGVAENVGHRDGI